MDITAVGINAGLCADDAGFDAHGDADARSWTDRLVEAASDYESIDPEAIAGLGCDGW